jgi:predicted DNA-binding antitoxin AbrB/MazE fold protein
MLAKEITMSIAIEAVWERGLFTPGTRPDLPEKTNVRLIVESPTQSTLGADLREIRARIVASGVPLLDDDEVLARVHSKRCGPDLKLKPGMGEALTFDRRDFSPEARRNVQS